MLNNCMGKKTPRRDKNKYFKKTNVEMINEEIHMVKNSSSCHKAAQGRCYSGFSGV